LLIGASAVGMYSPGYLLGNIIIMFIGPLNFVLPATLFKHYDCNRMDQVETLLSYSMKYFLAIAIPSAFGLSFLSRPILTILSTPQIAEQSYLITPFIALSMLLYGATSIVSNVLGLKKKMIMLCFAWTGAAALNLVLTFILVSYIGIIGAAIATLVAFVFLFLVISIYCLRQFRFKVDLRFIVKSVIAALAMYLVIARWPPLDLIGLFSVVMICMVVYVALLTLLGGLDKKEIEFFKGLLMS
jgi:O-antigen/teichoic acid export membrane protein